jgi:hypothetical protein
MDRAGTWLWLPWMVVRLQPKGLGNAVAVLSRSDHRPAHASVTDAVDWLKIQVPATQARFASLSVTPELYP